MQDRFDDALGADAGHATEINRARPAETGRARGSGCEQLMTRIARQPRTGQLRRRAAKGHDDRGPEGGGDVHWPGIVGQHDAAELEQGHKLPQRSLAGQIDNAIACKPGNLVAYLPIARAPKCQPAAIPDPPGDLARDGGEVLRGPPFGGAVFSAGIEPQQGRPLARPARGQAGRLPHYLSVCNHASSASRISAAVISSLGGRGSGFAPNVAARWR